jgi:multicomponent K+:H+ antiporter subunit G
VIASLLQHRPIVHEWLICLFLFMTVPVTAILLMQSARRRQRGRPDESGEPE